MAGKARSRHSVRYNPPTAGWSPEQADVRRMFEDNLQPMWITGACGIVDVNRAALWHYDCSRASFLARCAADMDATEGLGRGTILPVDALARDTGFVTVIARHRKRDGSLIDVELTSFAITVGVTPSVLISVVDVTHLRYAAAESTLDRAASETLAGSASRS